MEQLLAENATKQEESTKRSILFRMCNRLVAAVFNRWRAVARKIKTMEVVAAKIGKRLSCSEMHRAVCIWHDRAMRRHVSALCVRRWENHATAAAFRAWSDFRGQQRQITRLEQHAMPHLAGRIQNRHVCRALNTWHQVTSLNCR